MIHLMLFLVFCSSIINPPERLGGVERSLKKMNDMAAENEAKAMDQ